MNLYCTTLKTIQMRNNMKKKELTKKKENEVVKKDNNVSATDLLRWQNVDRFRLLYKLEHKLQHPHQNITQNFKSFSRK